MSGASYLWRSVFSGSDGPPSDCLQFTAGWYHNLHKYPGSITAGRHMALAPMSVGRGREKAEVLSISRESSEIMPTQLLDTALESMAQQAMVLW